MTPDNTGSINRTPTKEKGIFSETLILYLTNLNFYGIIYFKTMTRSQHMVKDYKRFRSEVRKGLHKVTITISDEAIDWFYELSRKMREKRGYKLPRSYIVRALINIFMKLDINVEGVRTERDLEERILDAIRKY